MRAMEERLGLRIESAGDKVRAELSLQMISQTRTMIVTLITVVVAIAAMALFTA